MNIIQIDALTVKDLVRTGAKFYAKVTLMGCDSDLIELSKKQVLKVLSTYNNTDSVNFISDGSNMYILCS